MITPKARPLDVLVAALHEFCLLKIFYMVDIISNVQLADLKSKLHKGKVLKKFFYRATGVRLYPPPGSEHCKLLCLNSFHVSTHLQVQSHYKPYKKQ